MRVKNINEDYIDIDVIRYFISGDSKYLIYSLGENDEAGYVKLYASKIVDYRACIITDNDEWDFMKQIIKEVVRNNRDGEKLNITDLDEQELSDIVLQDTRVFKLQGNLVTLLSENKKVLRITELEEQEEIIDESIDYEVLYNEQLAKNNDLQAQLDSLYQQIDKYKEKLSNIKDLLEQE